MRGLYIVLFICLACAVSADPLAIRPRDVKQLVFRPNEFAAGIRTPGTPRMRGATRMATTCNLHGFCTHGYSEQPSEIVCNNKGVDRYGEVIWQCELTASNVRLGRTEISWENYPTKDSATVLRGSESLEYELIPVSPEPVEKPGYEYFSGPAPMNIRAAEPVPEKKPVPVPSGPILRCLF